jgi:uncharacterized protein (TIGR03086 family)
VSVDLMPAAQRLADLVRGIPDDVVDAPTPCPDYTVGDLVDHIGGAARAFTGAAVKDMGEVTATAPSGDASGLGGDWRTRIPRDLIGMAEAWRDPAAWTGMTRAGSVDLPGEVAGLVALDEVVIHGWDLARGIGQGYECDMPSLEAVHGFVAQFSGPGQEAARAGLFGPVVDVPADAPLLDRVLGLAGRDPDWSPG